MVSVLPVAVVAAGALWLASKRKGGASPAEVEGAKNAAKKAAALPAGGASPVKAQVPNPIRFPIQATIKPQVKAPSPARVISVARSPIPVAVKVPGKLTVPVGTGPVNAAEVAVLSAQKLLQKLGVPFGALDGLYGPRTQAAWASAVRRWPPAPGPEFERREQFGRLDGSRAQVYRPSMQSLVAASSSQPKPVNTAVAVPIFTGGIPKPVAAAPKPVAAPGADRARAQRTAPHLAAHLKAKGRAGYSRQALKQWQVLAGLTVDGIYGPDSAAALRSFVPGAPAAFFSAWGAK